MTNYTVLPPLPLSDGGWSQVESLDSYLARLTMVTGERFATMRALRLQSGSKRSSLNSGSESSLAILRRTELLTGRSLTGGTLSALGHVLHRIGSGVSHSYRRWCPRCLLDNYSTGLSERLIWTFTHYDRCLIHGCSIQRVCNRCGNRQPSDGVVFDKRRRCSTCGLSLSGAGVPTDSTPISLWVNNSLEELVDWTSRSSQPVPSENYATYITKLSRTGGLDTLREACPVLWKDINQFRRRRATMTVLLNLAAIQGISVLDLLLRPEESASVPLFGPATNFSAIPLPPSSYGENMRRLVQVGTHLTAGDTLLPPVKVLAELLSVDVSGVHAADPQFASLYKVHFDRQSKARAGLGFRSGKAFRMAAHLVNRADGADDKSIAAHIACTLKMPQAVCLRTVQTAHAISSARSSFSLGAG